MPFRIALSGLNAATSDLNVTANNIANSNTTGFKASRTEFSDVFTASGLGSGGTAIGNGVRVAAVTQQFVGWITEGTWYSRDGATDYLAGLSRVTVPLCVVAGSRDRLALPASALEAHERAASFERCAVVVGPDSGASAHYDHLDLLFGRDAPRDVFPHIVAWISANGSPRP